MERAFDVVVVGGGLAGLTAAVKLARGGRAVAVVERKSTMGGRATTHFLDGYSLNEGAHAIYDGGPGRKVLEGLGVTLPGGQPSPNGALAVVTEGGVDSLHGLPGGPVSLLATGLLDLGGKLEVARLLNSMPRRDCTPWIGLPFSRFLDETTARPRVRSLVKMLARVATYSADVELVDAAVALRQVQLALDPGVTYVDGGWGTIVGSLEAKAREAGVSFVTTDGVAGVDHDGHVRGVRLSSGAALSARRVVLAVGPRVAASLAQVESLADMARHAIPVRAACLDLAVERLPFPNRRLALGLDRPLYYSVHSAVAKLAPSGGAVVHVMQYLSEGVSGGEAIPALEALFERLQPGAKLVTRRVMPSMVVAHARVDAGMVRPDVAVAEVSGLFVAGDWVGSNGLLADAALSSASTVADRILAGVGSPRAAA